MRYVTKKIHGVENSYRIPSTMHSELDILRKIFSVNSLPIETPIVHLIPRDPTFVICTAATHNMIARWSINFSFFWCYNVSPGITRCVIDKSVNRKKQIKLDVLEMAGLVINVAAAIHICWNDKIDIESFPVLLNACDGLSSNRWLNYRARQAWLDAPWGDSLLVCS